MKCRRSTYCRDTLLERPPAIQSSLDPPVVAVGGGLIQLAMRIESTIGWTQRAAQLPVAPHQLVQRGRAG
jgi:hypothetical protein